MLDLGRQQEIVTHRQIIPGIERNAGKGEGMCLTLLLRERSLETKMSPGNNQYKKEVDVPQREKPFRSDDPQDPNSALSHLIFSSYLIVSSPRASQMGGRKE